ncbi:MAG: AEC family transporter [Ruminiclostridium sp.]|nr:AEC family transporter [Ruminiclostridium sp.]
MTILTVFLQMLALLVMIAAGVIAAKGKMLDTHTNAKMSTMIVNIFNPMLILSSAAGAVGQVPLQRILLVFGIALGMFLFFILAGMVLTRFFSKDPVQRKIYQLMFVFSNLGFIGIPVVSSVLGAEYVVYVSQFLLIYNLVFYTYGRTLMRGRFNLAALRSLINPGNIACVLAMVLVLANILLPGFLHTAVDYLGGAASPLALVSVGFTLANANVKEIFGDKKLYLFTFLKLLVLPMVLLPLLRLLPVDDGLAAVCLVMFGMPVGSMPLMLITERGLDGRTCTAAVIMSTILCVVTVPILVSLI